jgi:hypothetical protein
LDPVPVILVQPEDPEATPDPTCSVCAIVIKPKSTSDEDSSTTVTLTHDADFEGDVELVVWLDTEEHETVWIPAVSISAGDEVVFQVEPGEGWSWDDVQFAWTRLHRRS